MAMIKQLFGYIHIVLGSLVALQFLASEIYSDDAVGSVWEVLNYLMAIGVVAALVFSYLRSQQADRSDLAEWIGSTAMLIAAAALFLLYFEQWFAWAVFKDADDTLGDHRSMVWIIIDVAFPIVNLIVGTHLLRTSGSSSGD